MRLPTSSNDWFRPTYYSNNNKLYTYNEFTIQLKKQITNKLNNNSNHCNEDEITLLIEDTEYNALNSGSYNDNKSLFPLLTIDSTQNITALKRIIKYNYSIYGMNSIVKANCDNSYGEGIYSTTNYDICKGCDDTFTMLPTIVIVNVLFTDKIKTVSAYKYYPDNVRRNSKKKLDYTNVIPPLIQYSNMEGNKAGGDIEGYYEDINGQYDTLRSDTNDVFVASSSSNIIPIAYVVINHRDSNAVPRQLSSGLVTNNNNFINIQHVADNIFIIYGDVYKVNNNKIEYVKNSRLLLNTISVTIVRHYIVIPYTLLLDPRDIETIGNYLGSLGAGEESTVVICGSADCYVMKSIHTSNNSAEYFKNNINNWISNNNCNKGAALLSGGIACVFELLTKDSENDKYINIVTIISTKHNDLNTIDETVCNKTTKIQSVVDTYQSYISVKKVILKIIYTEQQINFTLVDIKSQLQTVDCYESYYYTVTESHALVDVFDTIADENRLVPRSPNVPASLSRHAAAAHAHASCGTSFAIPYQRRVVGEGFITHIADFNHPIWDVWCPVTAVGTAVLYRGSAPQFISVDGTTYRTTITNSVRKQLIDIIKEQLNSKIPEEQSESIDAVTLWRDKNFLSYSLSVVLVPMIAAFRNYVFRYPSRCHSHLEHVRKLCTSLLDSLRFEFDDRSKINSKQVVNSNRMQFTVVTALWRRNVEKLDNIIKQLDAYFVHDLSIVDIANDSDDIDIPTRSRTAAMAPSLRNSIKHQIQKLLSDVTVFGNINFLSSHSRNSSRWLQNLMSMRYAKSVSKRAKHEQFDSIDFPAVGKGNVASNDSSGMIPYGVKIEEPSDALLYCDKIGTFIRLRSSAAAEVEPWSVIVEYVSTDAGCSSVVYGHCENGDRMVDSKGHAVTDLLLDDPCNDGEHKIDAIYKLYHGYVFTRTPYLYISHQPLALLVCSWVKTVENAFRTVFDEHIFKRPHDPEQVLYYLHIAESLYVRVRAAMTRIERNHLTAKSRDKLDPVKHHDTIHIVDWLELIEGDNDPESAIGKYLTTAYNIPSLCKVFAVLSLPRAAQFIINDSSNDEACSFKYSRFCVALLAESIMRCCRAKIRGSRKSPDDLILQALNLDTYANLSTWKFDIAHAINFSNKLIFHPYTNCSAFAVVSMLGYLECKHNGLTTAEIAERFSSENISMMQFLQRHMKVIMNRDGSKKGKAGPRITQVALCLHGLRYSKASMRQDSSSIFRDPLKIKADIVAEYMGMISNQQRVKSLMKEARHKRQVERMMKAQALAKYHTTPKVFTVAEVEDLNRDSRVKFESNAKKGDWVEEYVLQPSGLLLHHCCYPTCPQYLHCFMTQRDKINMATKPRHLWSRHGLMQHLQYDMMTHNYIPNFHAHAKCLAQRFHNSSDGFAQFCNSLKAKFDALKLVPNYDLHLQCAWDDYTSKH